MKLADDVCQALSQLTLAFPGIARMPQLDRKLYLQVDKALQALGGKWDHKRGAHVFSELPDGDEISQLQARIDLAIALGEATTNADLGFFPTPEPLAADLVAMAEIGPDHSVLEPSAGDGALYLSIINGHLQKRIGLVAPAFVGLVERDQKRRNKLKLITRSCDEVCEHDDFLDFQESEPYDRVVMNPPFCKVGRGDHLDHVSHAFSMLSNGGILVSVLPAGVLFRDDKRHRKFRAVYTGIGEIRPLPDDSFEESGTRVRTCVLKVQRK